MYINCQVKLKYAISDAPNTANRLETTYIAKFEDDDFILLNLFYDV